MKPVLLVLLGLCALQAAEPWALGDGGAIAAAGAPATWAGTVLVQTPGTVAGWIDQGVVAASGDVIRGAVEGFGPAGWRLRADLFGPLTPGKDAVALVVLGALPIATAEAESRRAAPGLLLANGTRMAGTLVALDADTVGLDTGRRVLAVPRSRVLAARVLTAPQTTPPAAWVRLANGDRLLGTVIDTGNDVAVEGLFGRRTVPRTWLRGGGGLGRRLALETLPPTAGTSVPATAAWRMAAGLRNDRSLVLAPGQEIIWELPGTWQRLVGLTGVADGTEPVVFQVDGDGRTLFTGTPQNAQDPVRALNVPLSGIHRLRLTVRGGSPGTAAVWFAPTLVP